MSWSDLTPEIPVNPIRCPDDIEFRSAAQYAALRGKADGRQLEFVARGVDIIRAP